MTDRIAFFGAKTITAKENELLETLGRLFAHGGLEVALTTASGASTALCTGYASVIGKPISIVDKLPADRDWIIYINAASAYPIIRRFPTTAPNTTWIAGVEKLRTFIEATMAILDERGLLPTRA